jgi:hypothetical protein
MVYPLDAVVYDLSSATTVTVVDKGRFKDGRNIVIDEVMNDPIPEIGREDFPLHGLIHHKTDAWLWLICFAKNLIAQCKYIGFQVFFELQSIMRVAFIFPRIVIRPKHVQRKFVGVDYIKKGLLLHKVGRDRSRPVSVNVKI